MRLISIAVLLLFVGSGVLVSNSAMAYTLFSGANNCNQCHSGFDGYSGTTHQTHIGMTACASCHISNGDNPEISTCSTCHDTNLLWNYHLQFAGNDGYGMDCGTCHTITPTQPVSWDEVKAMYQASLGSSN